MIYAARRVHRALGDTNRLDLVRRLAAAPATVSELIESTGLSQPLVSWHLRRLRSAGLVTSERSGRESIYTLRTETIAEGHALMNLGAFAFLAVIQGRPGATVQLTDLAGLGRKHPQIALLAALFLLSLTGIPPTAGFFAKAYVILSAVQAGGLAAALAIVAVLNAAIAAFYYLRVIVYLFMRDPAENEVQVATAPLLRVGLLIAAAGTILLGLLPGGLIEAVVQALAN